MVSKACVIGVPDGERLDDFTGLATSSDGVQVPAFVCVTGEYRVAIEPPGGGADNVLSAGYFTWTPDSLWHSVRLVLSDTIRGGDLTAVAKADTIAVALGGRNYVFQVLRGAQ
jgi:hypothetical protein